MVESTNAQGKTELFCSVHCLSAYSVQSLSTSGIHVQCNSCKTSAVPQYHLAMSDGSIRNFCSYNCVVNFQNTFSKPSGQPSTVVPLTQGQVIVSMPSSSSSSSSSSLVSTTSSMPSTGLGLALAAQPVTPGSVASSPVQRLAGQSQQQTQTPTQAQAQAQAPLSRTAGIPKLSCQHCHRLFLSKPELLQFKDRMLVFCGKMCFDEFKKVSFVMARCEYCKIEKIVKETIKFNKQGRSFCSEGCKLLYKHDLAKRWGAHCRSCTYCSSASQRVVQNHFAGKLEEFCSEECMSLYTVLFYQMAKCDACKRQGKLIESVKWHGEMKHFCNLQCLLVFCSQHSSAEASGYTVNAVGVPLIAPVPGPLAPQLPSALPSLPLSPPGHKEATPVIASVVSLASTPAAQPCVDSTAALQGAVPPVQAKIIEHWCNDNDSPCVEYRHSISTVVLNSSSCCQ
ncbi:UNVERIFIED_CONTAM: hypothetical protein FKN15_009455 [Acipenser sinensis]